MWKVKEDTAVAPGVLWYCSSGLFEGDDALAHPRDSYVWLHFFKLGVPDFPVQL